MEQTSPYAEKLYERITALPVVDIHSHLPPLRMVAREVEQVVFYHMMRYAYRAAGMSEAALWPGYDGTEPPNMKERPIVPNGLGNAMAALSTQGFGWGLRLILRDLYGFTEPLTEESLPRLRDIFQARTAQPDWGRGVLDQAGIREVYTSVPQDQEPEGMDATRFRLTMEVAPGTGIREHVPWQQRLERASTKLGVEVTDLASMEALITQYYDKYDWSRRSVFVAWVSSYADFRPVASSVVDRLLADALAGKLLTNEETALLEAAYIRMTCRVVRGRVNIFQLCYGTQFVSGGAPHPLVRTAPSFASSLGCLIAEFPDLHFNLLNSVEADEQTLCSLCLAYENVSLGGFWFYNFYPTLMQQAWQRRLDMVPLSRLCGFFSDGYSVDWIYARLRITQRVLANTLAERAAWGWCTAKDAVEIARILLWSSPRALFGE